MEFIAGIMIILAIYYLRDFVKWLDKKEFENDENRNT